MKNYKIRNKSLDFPLIQGGMGVGVSTGGLAGYVAKSGCMGVVSTVNIGYDDSNFEKEPLKANQRALREQIKKAKKIAGGKGMVAINLMVAANHYDEMVASAVDADVDAIISGAGLPLNLPTLVKGKDVAIAPIVSGGKAAKIILKKWLRSANRLPDFIVVEGTNAGGHLGFSLEELKDNSKTLSLLLKEVLTEVAPYEKEHGVKIPVFVAGSVFNGKEMADYMKAGAYGAQIGTRFIATHECDASETFKNMIVNSKEEDLRIIISPVGMPGRALNTPLVEKLQKIDRIPPQKCLKCLRTCDFKTTKYCISNALAAAVRGNIEEGLFFSGVNVGKIHKIIHVHDLIDEIREEWRCFY